jgi:hypothetical protein
MHEARVEAPAEPGRPATARALRKIRVRTNDAEARRIDEDSRRLKNWKRWGPYLSERQWGTVREDYSEGGNCWEYFSHDQARSRAYRWGEDGLLGITDRECRLCFAIALWNGRDPILKERLFGLTGPEGNHGEDVKELYYYLDSTPTHSYMKALYKYPQAEYPYARLVEENRRRGKEAREFELLDTGIFDENRYFDVLAEYAKAAPDDVLLRITIANRGPEDAELHVLPTLWFRNTWSWGRKGEGYWAKPAIERVDDALVAEHATLGRYRFSADSTANGSEPQAIFTENETNARRLYNFDSGAYKKDAFHEYVIRGRADAVNAEGRGTKAAYHYRLMVPGGETVALRLRLTAESEAPAQAFGQGFDRVFAERTEEADAFYAERLPKALSEDERSIARQAYAGLLWSKQFYHYVIPHWLAGDPQQPPPPETRRQGRNNDWRHLYNRDVISMPDKWEYPWYAAWDLAFHMVPFARVDPEFAKHQLTLFLREWYMHPSGQMPAYEFALSDVNPPVHAWSVWRVYKISAARGERDRRFLAGAFQKLLLNFTWWVNRKDTEGKNLFSGGFLGLDNIGVFDRSQPLPTGGHLEQADGTAWMAFYCATMLAMALELAKDDPVYEDLASKFFEHFVAIVDAMNSLGGTGLWDEQDGFYYDQLHAPGQHVPLRVRSLVGLMPLIAVELLDHEITDRLPGFSKRLAWFFENRPELGQYVTCREENDHQDCTHQLLAVPTRERLERVLRYLLDEQEFLSPYGIRSVSRIHEHRPYVFHADGREHRVDYVPGESNTWLFGGNSNWRGPIWFPINYLIVEALERYHKFYADTLLVECPTGSGRMMNLQEVAREIASRLTRPFLPDAGGRRPVHDGDERYAADPHWRDLVLFYEYFHADTGRGVGASHQTGWTALVVRALEDLAGARSS